MKIVLVGPGALGLLWAGFLASRTDHELWLLGRQPERAARLAATGLRLTDGEQELLVPVKVTAQPESIGTAELLVFCVKSHQFPAALAQTAALQQEGGLLIALQNGIAHLDHLVALPPTRLWAVGTTAQGATLLAPNHVKHGGNGPTKLGFLSPPSPRGEELLAETATIFTRAGLPTAISPDIVADLWAKLLVNVGINALTALHDCPNGQLAAIPEAAAMLEAAVQEAAAVATAKGITLRAEPVAACWAVCRSTAANLSSMLQDLRAGRPTEINAINGAIVREGEKLGIPTPANLALFQAVSAREQECLR